MDPNLLAMTRDVMWLRMNSRAGEHSVKIRYWDDPRHMTSVWTMEHYSLLTGQTHGATVSLEMEQVLRCSTFEDVTALADNVFEKLEDRIGDDIAKMVRGTVTS